MRKIVLLAMACLLVAGGWAVAGGVPDTGIDFCTDGQQRIPCPKPGEPFYGQDANYQGNARSYTKLGAGGVELPDSATQEGGWLMTRDNFTGLVWELKNSVDYDYDYANPHDADNVYTWCMDGVGTCDGQDTTTFINTVNAAHYGGFSDWRLPTRNELFSLFNSPIVYAVWFPQLGNRSYWSSSYRLEEGGFLPFSVDIDYGGSVYNFESIFGPLMLGVRAVRAGQ